MRKVSFMLMASVLLTLSSSAQITDNKRNDWVGVIVKPKLPMIFHITGDSLSGFHATFDNPAQRIMGVKCKQVTIKGDSLTIELGGGIPVTYRGKYQPARDSISGVWVQGEKATPLDLKRMIRPQTPKPPFHYRFDSVEYDNTGRTVHLGATLTRPEGSKKYPVAILITGSGQQDRDETLFDHKPFAVIADYLTEMGIAVLRVDDRGKGKSTGDVQQATSADFADDVLTSIAYLKTRTDIDTARMGLIGHSEGGFIAPLVYSKWPHLRFLVLLAGPGVPGSEIVLRQQTDPVKDISQAAYAAYYPLIKTKLKILNETYGEPDSITLSQVKTEFIQWQKGVPDSILDMLHARNVPAELYATQVSLEMRPWFRYFYKTDPARFLQQVKCPVLALNGEKDSQVDAVQNITAIHAALRKGGNRSVTTHIFPGLNHLFQHCGTGSFSEYPVIDETFAPEVLKMMGSWIQKMTNL